MTSDTRNALYLMGELLAALRANNPDLFKRWLAGGIEDLGEEVNAGLAQLIPDSGRAGQIDGWHPGVSL